MGQVAYQSGTCFWNMKWLGVFLLPPGWDASPSQGHHPALKFAGTHLYTSMIYIHISLCPFHSFFFMENFISVFCRNGENVEGATHKHVVNLIKKGGDKLTLVVISVSQQEAEKLDSESSSGGEYYDYSDKRAVPVSIPETRQVVSDGETYMVRDVACITGVFWRASARIFIRRAPSWTQTRKRQKVILGSRCELKEE